MSNVPEGFRSYKIPDDAFSEYIALTEIRTADLVVLENGKIRPLTNTDIDADTGRLHEKVMCAVESGSEGTVLYCLKPGTQIVYGA